MSDYLYTDIMVESFYTHPSEPRHGVIHIRPLPGQSPFEPEMFVECSNTLKHDYPVGTKFIIRAKITDRQGGTSFIYSHYSWPFKVLSD